MPFEEAVQGLSWESFEADYNGDVHQVGTLELICRVRNCRFTGGFCTMYHEELRGRGLLPAPRTLLQQEGSVSPSAEDVSASLGQVPLVHLAPGLYRDFRLLQSYFGLDMTRSPLPRSLEAGEWTALCAVLASSAALGDV